MVNFRTEWSFLYTLNLFPTTTKNTHFIILRLLITFFSKKWNILHVDSNYFVFFSNTTYMKIQGVLSTFGSFKGCMHTKMPFSWASRYSNQILFISFQLSIASPLIESLLLIWHHYSLNLCHCYATFASQICYNLTYWWGILLEINDFAIHFTLE